MKIQDNERGAMTLEQAYVSMVSQTSSLIALIGMENNRVLEDLRTTLQEFEIILLNIYVGKPYILENSLELTDIFYELYFDIEGATQTLKKFVEDFYLTHTTPLRVEIYD